VAWVAHLGGFFTGMLTVTLFTPVRPEAANRKASGKKARGGRGKRK
jgi:membrane associated rhomboid family serine protease